MSKAAFIIYTRTKCCDYPSQLNVYPDGIPQPVFASMRDVIVSAAQSIDTLDQDKVRRVIYSAEDYVIAGMVAFLKYLADGRSADSNMFTDAKERSIYAFVGLVFKKGQKAPLITNNSLWEGFKKYMSPVWEQTSCEAQNAAFDDFEEAGSTENPQDEQTAGGINFYTINGDDSAVFEYYLEKAAKGEKVSFCSNIVDFRVIKDRAFDIITTTPNLIARAKKELSALSAARRNSINEQGSHIHQSGKTTPIPNTLLKYVNNNNQENVVGITSFVEKWDNNYTNRGYYVPDDGSSFRLRKITGASNNTIQLKNDNINVELSIQFIPPNHNPNKRLDNRQKTRKTKYTIVIYEETDE